MADNSQPDMKPIFKKVVIKNEEAHGGAWKVAYADFVTAMMAFFLLLWLLQVSDEEQKLGVSQYFEPVGAIKGSSGSGGVFGGISASAPGPIAKAAITPSETSNLQARPGSKQFDQAALRQSLKDALGESEQLSAAEQREEDQFSSAKSALEQAISQVAELQEIKQSIKIENTEEGLRIQMSDQQDSSMFAPGSARMSGKARNLLLLVASVAERLPNKITISGHTDAEPFNGTDGRTNWELSLDRANSARRAIVEQGIPEVRISNVIGRADRDLLDPSNPTSPANRRITVTLLRSAGKEATKAIPSPPRIIRE
jgi:chemotaxis protein MotB